MTVVAQVFPRNQVGNGAKDADNSGKAGPEGSAILHLGTYLPSLSTDDQQQGNRGNQDNAANVLAALGAPTDEFEAFVGQVTQLPNQVDRPIGSRATNAALWAGWTEYTPNNMFDVSRMDGWGDYRGYRRGGDRFTPLNGKPITFDPNDIGISLSIPWEEANQFTSVEEADYTAVYYNHREAHVNEKGPMKHRLGVYNLSGLDVGGSTDIA